MLDKNKYHDCIEAIQKELASDFDGYRVGSNIAKKVVKEFGFDTVKTVIANSIQRKHYDGRISRDNKAWAKDVDITIASHQTCYCILDVNAGLLNIIANQFRKLEKELKPSALEQLSAIKADAEPKPKITKTKDKEVR